MDIIKLKWKKEMNKKLFLRLNMSYINGRVCHLVSLIYNSFIRLMNHVYACIYRQNFYSLSW